MTDWPVVVAEGMSTSWYVCVEGTAAADDTDDVVGMYGKLG